MFEQLGTYPFPKPKQSADNKLGLSWVRGEVGAKLIRY